MKQTSGPAKAPAEAVVKGIRRATRRHFSAEDKIRVVLEGLRGEDSIAELCRREGIVAAERKDQTPDHRPTPLAAPTASRVTSSTKGARASLNWHCSAVSKTLTTHTTTINDQGVPDYEGGRVRTQPEHGFGDLLASPSVLSARTRLDRPDNSTS